MKACVQGQRLTTVVAFTPVTDVLTYLFTYNTWLLPSILSLRAKGQGQMSPK